MATRAVIRTIYLYVFSVLGLVLAVIGAVGMIDLLLKAAIFKKAESQRVFYESRPQVPPGLVVVERAGRDTLVDLKERELLRDWARQYEDWRERNKDFDPVRAEREKSAARNLALLAVGIPLYLYHWRAARREAT